MKAGNKEAQLRELRERRGVGDNTGTISSDPPGESKQEKDMNTKTPAKSKRLAAVNAKAGAKLDRALKRAADKANAGKRTRVPGVDRSPLAVGTFIARKGGASMAELEKAFKMDAHPLRAKIHDARHKLGFKIDYDAEKNRYFGAEPKHKAA